MKKGVGILILVLVALTGKSQVLSADELDTVTVYADLQEALNHPENVYALDLSKQKLNDFPRGIFKLTNLNILILKKNKIAVVPDSIFMLKNLQELNLAKNKLTEINDSIYRLKHLKRLDLSENKIEVLSYKISYLNQLENLIIWGLPITKIPEEIYDLSELVFLDVRQIYFTPKDRIYIEENLPNAKVKISNMCDCGN